MNIKKSESVKKYWAEYKAKFGKRPTYKRDEQHRAKMALAKKGQTHSGKSRKKISEHHHDVNGKNNPMYGRRGELHPAWKGGISTENDILRKSLEFRQWRTAVFKRDHYTCIWCGDNKSGKLNADHIKPWSLYPDLRFDVGNGRTLCEPCHKLTPTYAGKLNNKEVRALYA